jgi:2-dehydropantoate 2-reductase
VKVRSTPQRRGSEAIRIGQARGYKLEEIDQLPPETIARDGEGDATTVKDLDQQRRSMGQDVATGRRTEIEFLNGFVVRAGEQVGNPGACQ